MLHRFIRDSFFGRTVYHLSHRKFFRHPEEQEDYQIPDFYYPHCCKEKDVPQSNSKRPVGAEGMLEPASVLGQGSKQASSSSLQTVIEPQFDSELYNSKEYIIVDWNGPDDLENPRNWSWYAKTFFIGQISLLTMAVYMASALYTPAYPDMMEELGWSEVELSLGVFLFVLGYGIGPLFWSPLSENVEMGRTSIYIFTLFIFAVLQIPTALTTTVGGFCVLRFLAGFFASPCLSTGAASVADVTHPWNLPQSLSAWSLAADAGPSFGPFFGAILTVKGGWRWCFWFILIVSGFVLLIFIFSFPESYAPTLLARRAKRLRAITGNDKITSVGLLENHHKKFKEIVVETLWRPIEITFMEPVVLLIDLYIALLYCVMYLFFEVFPVYFVDNRNFTTIELGLCYLALIVGVFIALLFYIPVMRHYFTKPIIRGEQVYPEVFIPLAIVGGVFLAAGLFIFGWSATTFTHWIGPLVGIAIVGISVLLLFQTLLNYLGYSFKTEYLASVFASNNLVRSILASVFPIFGKALFNNLSIKGYPVGWGISVVAFIALAMIAIPVLFYLNGPKLRARSKYAND
ncbi:benomyl/methotrexate resistance protein [Lodderomyces elongisporus NRRL YB-4239]|uniref:Benomyl/methotrexate resistance protein n=1 Tax=Lodderomyces elongisporus (strain ATCC 11503 / CBS 2605 / JCM 1781 / NBRC 1676 / NRRL YB-4239) TaxID=379508 RepID=A5DT27_LODEL|nr:benomyl/methotrexate resistance protein [Lodderomyces elongisporus NRRL YB-4239]